MKEKRRISSGFKNIFNKLVRYSRHEFATKLPRNEITNFEMPTDCEKNVKSYLIHIYISRKF